MEMKMRWCSTTVLLSCVALALVAASGVTAVADPPIEVTTETKERIVLIRGLPYRVGRFCRTAAQVPDVGNQTNTLRQGGAEGVWVERAVSAQWYARFENTWTCTILRARAISSPNGGSDGEPPYDDNSSWTQAIFQGNLLTPQGFPVTRVGNIARKTALNKNKQGSTLYISFDKDWYYYYNRMPWRIILDSGGPSSLNRFMVVYSCYSLFQTQFETVIAYTKSRSDTIPYGSITGLETELASLGIELAVNNQLQVTVQSAFCPDVPEPESGPVILESPPPPGAPPAGSPPPFAPPGAATPPPPFAPPPGPAASPPPFAPPPGPAASPPPFAPPPP